MKDYAESLAWLYNTQLFGIKPGLEPALRMASELGIPLHAGADGGRRVLRLHVAGTNGKGSTCAMLASICRAAGLKTGLYTSPHLVSFRERIQIDGAWIPETAVLEGLQTLRALVEHWDPHPTFFELVTLLALRWFHQNSVDVMVLETGMGGRLDATNVVTPSVSVLTPVALDHQKQLGNTLSDIAREKAGIIKPEIPAVSAPQEPVVRDIFSETARDKNARLQWVVNPWTAGAIGLRGEVQRWNAAVARAACELSGWPFAQESICRGIAQVQWPGRFERHGRNLVLDGAHNPHAMAGLVQTWRAEFGASRAHVVFGAADDKDVPAMLRLLVPIAASVTVVSIQGKRAIAKEMLERMARDAMGNVPVEVADSLAGVLARESDEPRLVTGSLFLVGEAFALLKQASRELSLQ